MMALLFLLYFAVGVQIVFAPNRFILLQFLACLLLTLGCFNLHSHLVIL
ncbi:DUF5993 family protein [Legionella dresdenensis]|uniref:DUF5993 family protein n=1 Tax=Legionella dresdenensis TaxID=450200 RepID=A0ABV8CDC8_9GAMM